MTRLDVSILDLMTPAQRRSFEEASLDAHSVEFVADPIVMGSGSSRYPKGRVIVRPAAGPMLSITIDGGSLHQLHRTRNQSA